MRQFLWALARQRSLFLGWSFFRDMAHPGMAFWGSSLQAREASPSATISTVMDMAEVADGPSGGNPEQIRKVRISQLGIPQSTFDEFDLDRDGHVHVTELVAYVQKHKGLQSRYKFVKQAFMMSLFALGILLTKEVTVSGHGLVSSRESRNLTSTLPEEAFEELKSVTLNLPHQNGEVIKVVLDVNGFNRRFVVTSRCGSVVDLDTIHGQLTLDDTQLFASTDFVEKMNTRGFNMDEDAGLMVTDTGRRLSVGSDIAGMFNFFQEYEYKCESMRKPLQALTPPFAFTLDTYQLCEEDTCYSQINSSAGVLGLPGLTRDPYFLDTFVKGLFIKAQEEVYAMGSDQVITVERWPNYPMMVLTTMRDFAAGTFTQKQIFNNSHATSCRSREINEDESSVASFADFAVAAVGSTSYNSEPDRKFNRYVLYHKDRPDNLDAQVEFWEEATTGIPHKYFLPNIPDSPRAYFTSFRNNISQQEFDAVKFRIETQDCHGPQILGLTAPVIDQDNAAGANESTETLEFYRSLAAACEGGVYLPR
ncbi:unnamed protein product [Effrenium voratum]|nr:unnamed protein product [Effrenium voratum]CAJ1451308.1 unnamed protein product [Effrenium voratum]